MHFSCLKQILKWSSLFIKKNPPLTPRTISVTNQSIKQRVSDRTELLWRFLLILVGPNLKEFALFCCRFLLTLGEVTRLDQCTSLHLNLWLQNKTKHTKSTCSNNKWGRGRIYPWFVELLVLDLSVPLGAKWLGSGPLVLFDSLEGVGNNWHSIF